MATESSPMFGAEGDCSEVLEELMWRDTGENLAMSKHSEKVIEQKEQQLKESIQRNYSKLKGVEKELEGLQLQLRLTSGPKKSALELIRRKIEAQNEKVLASRSKVAAAKRFLAVAEAELAGAQSVKQQLCGELNMLVHQSTHLQLAKLEELSQQLDGLEAASTSAGSEEGSASAQSFRPAASSADAMPTFSCDANKRQVVPAAEAVIDTALGSVQLNPNRPEASQRQEPVSSNAQAGGPGQVDPRNLPLKHPNGLSPIRTSAAQHHKSARRGMSAPALRPPGRPSPIVTQGVSEIAQKNSSSASFSGFAV
ncbi:unnamed protein product [Ostreobium quekettii]|uniref:RAB6-interacting golgin n=1 Tax=Ostreobium quekettii TaxID=121088 RepID=A0A8S1J1T6_9CHLO|nr:unnamed protein product [Ostreobium quekettii]|eukprot:evm.model.scf_1134.4 EVM.evm.TU.scf_1134.4   scf_1134:42230-45452(-)